jgi:hypothetical protein
MSPFLYVLADKILTAKVAKDAQRAQEADWYRAESVATIIG